MDDLARRDFLKIGGAAIASGTVGTRSGAAAAQPTSALTFAAPPIETVRIGFVGIGAQGSNHVRSLVKIPGCRITAVCDVRAERTDWATQTITAAGDAAPAV